MLSLVFLRKKLWRVSAAPGKGFELICEKMMHSSQRGTAVLKNRVCYGVPALALFLVQLNFSAHAFTLGNVHGSALIGRPLEVSIQVQSDVGEAVANDCVTAQVFYAQARQSAVKVSVLPATGTSTGSRVHVRSSAAVDEPVVTLEVRATCGSSTQRRYVLLADFPPQAAAVSTLPSIPGEAPAVPVVVVSAAASPSPESGTASAAALSSGVGSGKVVVAKVARRTSSVQHVSTSAATGAAGKSLARKVPVRSASQSVLKLDPSDLLSDRIDLLDSTTLFAPTEDALRHSHQITSLEGDVKTLRALVANHDARMSDLNVRLQQAQANQMPPWLLYAFAGLVALVLVCLAALLWLWRQLQRRGQQDAAPSWWHGQAGAREDGPPTELLAPAAPMAPETVGAPIDAPMAPLQPELAMPASAPFDSTTDVDIDLGFGLLQESLHGTFEVSTGSAPFEPNSIRHISVEPILDIRQQAEFFVSLGQTDRALQILKKQIEESAEPNPFVYLDLITLYHSLGLKAEFRECRSAFAQLFNGLVPDFPVFHLEGRDLEAYPEVLANLVSLWPRMDALAFLSACIFREANAQHGGTFDLAAFRDLLMLHAQLEALLVLRPDPDEIVESADTAAALFGASVAPVTRSADGLSSRMLDIDFLAPTEPFPSVK